MKILLLLLLVLPVFALADQESEFRAARDAFRAGDANRLDKAAARLDDSPLEPYVTAYRLRLRGWGDNEVPFIKAFLARKDQTPVIDQFRSDWLKFLGKKQRWTEFAEEYPRLVNLDQELSCYALQLHRLANLAEALNEARQLWFSGTETPDSCAPLFSEAIAQGILGEDDIWQRMRLALETGNTALAKQLAATLPAARTFPAAELNAAAANPKHYLEKTRFDNAGAGRRMVALFALQRLSRQSPQVAYTEWQRIAGNFSAEEQRYFFGWLGLAGALAQDERALEWFAAAGDTVLNTRQLAWRTRAALRAQNWHEVWASINAMAPEQQSEGAWRYWKGRALKVLGRPADAENLFAELSREYNFYGQLAAEELGAAAAAGMVSAGYRQDDAEVAEFMAQPAVQRTMLLYRMEMRVDAAKEWAWATRGVNDKQLLIAAEVARRNEMYDRSINAADRTVQLHDFTLRYPAPYRDVLQENLQKHGLEEAWVYGLMRQESRFTTQAKSSVGAAGLMQIMPATASWVAKRMGMKGYRKGMIHQLDVNIQLGTYYMKNVSTLFDDNPVLASAAYNAGPSRARQWRGPRALEGAISVETIPFDETRDYVKKVMSNTVYYSKLFGEPPRSLKQRLGIIAARTEQNQEAGSEER